MAARLTVDLDERTSDVDPLPVVCDLVHLGFYDHLEFGDHLAGEVELGHALALDAVYVGEPAAQEQAAAVCCHGQAQDLAVDHRIERLDQLAAVDVVCDQVGSVDDRPVGALDLGELATHHHHVGEHDVGVDHAVEHLGNVEARRLGNDATVFWASLGARSSHEGGDHGEQGQRGDADTNRVRARGQQLHGSTSVVDGRNSRASG
ncbi:MAG: hypothetical protein R2770_10140 [Acidimicrobiales bacterium]